MQVDIDPERVTDYASIRQVVADAFAHHPAVSDLVELIRASTQYEPDLALVARRNGTVVGHIMVSGAELVAHDGSRHDVLTLSPLAVHPEVQRQGIGAALVDEALRRAVASAGAPLITLEGSPTYYARFGFVDCRSVGVMIDLPGWAPREAGQVYLLPGYDSAIRGRLEYPSAFTRLNEIGSIDPQ